MKKTFEINALYGNDETVTGNSPRQPRSGAVVEFSTRAGIGLARD
ncbi:MAG TPA: hypothetical protein VJN68_02375 [Burkholderiaceae bacterium]|nr:hypothetical protein [Burkholderiaceae bacterium]